MDAPVARDRWIRWSNSYVGPTSRTTRPGTVSIRSSNRRPGTSETRSFPLPTAIVQIECPKRNERLAPVDPSMPVTVPSSVFATQTTPSE
jgi:hypothetical protein